MISHELTVIGCILIEPRSLQQVRSEVSLSDFQTDFGKAIFTAACTLTDSNFQVDPVTIKMKAAENGYKVSNSEILDAMGLSQSVPISNLSIHLQGMKDEILRTKMLESISQVQQRLIKLEPTRIVCTDFIAQLESAMKSDSMTGIVSSQESILDFGDHRIKIENGEVQSFISTGFNSLDNALGGGFVPQSLNILAARPGCGKTTFALQIAEKIAGRGIPTLFVSLEMPDMQLNSKRLGIEIGASPGRLLMGKLDGAEEEQKLMEAMEKLGKVPLYFSKENKASVGSIGVMARKLKNCGFIVIDYLGLLQYEQGKSLYEQVTKTSNALKQLALSTGIPILCLCQLNRDFDNSKYGSAPKISHLRDSGAIEQDADTILLLHNPNETEERKENEPTYLSCKVGKNRHGPAGKTVEFNWYMKTGKIISAVNESAKYW